ncbi:MAG: conjugal transfer protein TraE [Sphingomonadales bacterium]|nr:conjugal transfer protein TraE [Sphingomonadales bacterium]
MDTRQAFADNTKYLAQRNMIAGISGFSLFLNLILGVYVMFRDETVVLQPVIQQPLKITGSHITSDYLELVTRDTAIAVLNRTPASIDYWMNNVLRITDPAAYGQVKTQLLRVKNQLGDTDITQHFEPLTISTYPDDLRSEVTGIVYVYVGSAQVSETPVRYEFNWTYRGLSLKLSGFKALQNGPDENNALTASQGGEGVVQ